MDMLWGLDWYFRKIVADHGSANIAEYTKTNIEVQGLEL